MGGLKHAAGRQSTGPVRLIFGSAQKVEVIAEDKHRFYMSVSEAAQACKAFSNAALWADEFKDFLVDLHKWCSDRPERVESCFVTWGEGGLTVYVITKSEDYDFGLDDELHELDLHMAAVYPDCPAEILQIPSGSHDELNSFFSPERSVQAYGDKGTTPEES
ncbi:MAG: hypothetical protein KY476_22155 [Planctomycetes bacterium]|nr:hypothetical protein [Planctomycetota bacterium]